MWRETPRVVETFMMNLENESFLKTKKLKFLKFVTQSAVLVLLAIILELSGGIFMLVHGTHNSKLTPWLEKRFIILIRDSNYNDKANDLLNVVQENVMTQSEHLSFSFLYSLLILLP